MLEMMAMRLRHESTTALVQITFCCTPPQTMYVTPCYGPSDLHFVREQWTELEELNQHSLGGRSIQLNVTLVVKNYTAKNHIFFDSS